MFQAKGIASAKGPETRACLACQEIRGQSGWTEGSKRDEVTEGIK